MNSCCCRVRDIAPRICAAAFVCIAAGASAQTVYKQVDAAGRVAFSDRAGTTANARTVTVSALDVANALASNAAISSRPAAAIDASEAARRLGQARLEREQGAQALPREQAQGTNAGAVNHRYWQRQEKLRRMVEQALHRSNETHPSKRVRRAARENHRPRNETLARDVSVSH